MTIAWKMLWWSVLAVPAYSAPFPFNALIQFGSASTAEPEIILGDASSTSAIPLTMSPYWSNGQSREFRFIYTRPTNSLEVRVYNNGSTTTFGSFSFNPTAGPAPLDAVWTLPASQFFAVANSGTGSNGISISNLGISSPTGGAVTILSPMTTTSLNASSGGALPTQTITQGQNVTFRGDANGSWQLTGFVTMNFSGLPTNSTTRMQFGMSASADTPEPTTWLLSGLGVLLARAVARR